MINMMNPIMSDPFLGQQSPMFASGPSLGLPELGGMTSDPLGDGSGIPLLGMGGMGDMSLLSPEVGMPDADMSALTSGLMGAYDPQGMMVQQLQQQIMELQMRMAMAQSASEQASISQQMQMLMAQLSTLMGGDEGALGGLSPALSGPAAGGVPAASGGAPASSGGSSSGGAPSSSGGASPSSGGTAGSSGGSSSSAGGSSSGSVTPSDGGEPGQVNTVPPKLAKDDKALAQYIESKLEGSPLAGQGMGAQFVAAGREYDVDPLVLTAISKHETNFGSLGVGVAKHMGVGAFDDSPDTPRQWDGAVDQIQSGAKTFANLREQNGSNSKAPLSEQLAAVGKSWATDPGWSSKVGATYNEIVPKGGVPQSSGGKSSGGGAPAGGSSSGGSPSSGGGTTAGGGKSKKAA